MSQSMIGPECHRATASWMPDSASRAAISSLKRTWESLKEVMSPDGALDPVVKEMLYLAVSITNGCGYCIASHGAAARKAGMTAQMHGELLAVVGMANETNRLAFGAQVPIDPQFR